jgi:hypothetical protein
VKQKYLFTVGILALVLVFGMTVIGCPDPNNGGGGNQTPVAGDFTIGKLNQTAGSVTAVTISPKGGKSSGAITIKYAGNTTIPQTAGTYAVTFDVAAATGWNAATNLPAGNLIVSPGSGPQNTTLDGTWIGEGVKLILNNGSLEVIDEEFDVPYYKGTYTANNGNLTMTITHLYFSEEDLEYFPFDEVGYYTESEMKTAFRAVFEAMAIEEGLDPADPYIEALITEQLDAMWDEWFSSSFVTQTGTYSISGNTLTITIDGDVQTFTKQS